MFVLFTTDPPPKSDFSAADAPPKSDFAAADAPPVAATPKLNDGADAAGLLAVNDVNPENPLKADTVAWDTRNNNGNNRYFEGQLLILNLKTISYTPGQGAIQVLRK